MTKYLFPGNIAYEYIPPEKKSICAVIITYNPEADFSINIAQVAQQVDKVIIVDNGSSNFCLKKIQEICSIHNAFLIMNFCNRGVATALNQGIEYAKNCDYEWILTLDQDSFPTDKMVEKLIAVYYCFPDKKHIGVIAANPIDGKTGNCPYKTSCKDKVWIQQKVVITSGSLFPIKLFNYIGPFKDEFFIDGVDQEYCLRLKKNGYQVIIACKAHLIHSLGQPKICEFIGISFIPMNCSPLRYYYITRNSLSMIREYLFSEPCWIIQHLMGFIKRLVKMLLFEENKWVKVKSITKGIWHGLIGKSGPLN